MVVANMKMPLVIIATIILSGVAHSQADEAAPDYVLPSWRARLVTMAPVCGRRSAAWSKLAGSAIDYSVLSAYPTSRSSGADKVLKDHIKAVKDHVEEAKGALYMARFIGTKLARVSRGALCPAFVTNSALVSTDNLVEISQTWQEASEHSPTGIAMSDSTKSAAYMAFMVAVDVGCSLYNQDWGDDRFADVIGEIAQSLDQDISEDDRNALFLNAEGAAQMAFYGGERLVDDEKSSACAYARTRESQVNVRKLLADHEQIVRKMLNDLPSLGH